VNCLIEQEVLNRIRYLLEYNHWSIYKLAKVSNMSYSSLNNIFVRQTCPSIATLEKICNGFGISLSEFFDYKKNPLRQESLSEEQQELLITYNSFSGRKKELLNAYLKGLDGN
jgi:transcriptional regulator with XRE-family HTH domain